jgi:hypothetical protein
MAAADYWLCDVCGNKTFYDANLDYHNDYPCRKDGRMLPRGCGDAASICERCAETHEVVIKIKRQPTAPTI